MNHKRIGSKSTEINKRENEYHSVSYIKAQLSHIRPIRIHYLHNWCPPLCIVFDHLPLEQFGLYERGRFRLNV